MYVGRASIKRRQQHYLDRLESLRYIQFDTIYQHHGFWKVFAVIEYDIRDSGFQYRQFQFSGNADFMDWIEKAVDKSLYEADMDIAPQSHILTLSTCDRSKYGRNGRLLILTVEMNETE